LQRQAIQMYLTGDEMNWEGSEGEKTKNVGKGGWKIQEATAWSKVMQLMPSDG
jgi:hypothetical protein